MNKPYMLYTLALMFSFSALSAMEKQNDLLASNECCNVKESSSLRDLLYWSFAMKNKTSNPILVQDIINQILCTSYALMKKCSICFDEKDSTEFLTTDCNERFCKECLTDSVSASLYEHNTKNLKCLNRSCLKQLTEPAIKAITIDNKAIYDRYLDLTFDEYFNEESQGKQCPTVNCPVRFIASECNEIIKCQNCHEQYCSHCLKDHPSFMTCDRYKFIKGILEESRAIPSFHTPLWA